ncbi:MAG: ABC transporter permease [Salinibacter sp.]
MLRDVLKIAIRRIRRQPLYAVLNVAGLALGMAVCLLIGLYLYGELRVDRFHQKSERIVQVGVETDFFGRGLRTSYPLADVLEQNVPPIQQAVHTRPRPSRTVRNPASDLERSQRVLTASPGFFETFTFPALHGDPSEALAQTNALVLTASAAETFFGRTAVVGRPLTVDLADSTRTLTVRAVVQDPPEASTIQFDAVAPIRLTERDSWSDGWGMFMFQTYALLNEPDVDRSTLTDQIQRAVDQHTDREFEYFSTDLTSVYLSPLHQSGGFRGQARYLYIFGAVALFVLLIATINYVNLATAQGARRAREVGMRKTLGAGRGRLIRRFLGESTLLSTVALLVALGLAAGTLPAFNHLFGTHLSLTSGPTGLVLLGLSVVVLGIGVAAGAYPALVLSRYDPMEILRQQSTTSASRGGWLRRGLVVVQFAISAALIVSTIILYQQLQYVQSKDLGFDGERVVTVEIPDDAQGARQTLAREARAHPATRRVSVTNGVPMKQDYRLGLSPDELSPDHDVPNEDGSIRFAPAVIDSNYVEALGLRLVAGRDIDDSQIVPSERAVLLNETGARRMGWTPEEAVGKPFSFGEQSRTVVGVVDDYHIVSLHNEIEPVALLGAESERFTAPYVLTARLAPDAIRDGLDHLEQSLATVAPGASFEYSFLDDTFDQAYRAEQRLGRIFAVFAALAILIACMGLFGLAAHAADRRTREIGVRKALGATASQIVGLVSKEFAALVGVALVLGTPVAYIGMQRWLQDFAYRIELGALPFLVTAGGAFVIAGLTVSVHALRAARTDPATTLRDE